MQTKYVWIAGGAILLMIMLLAAAFSLGVYLERYGLTGDGLAYQRPAVGAPGGPANPDNPGQPPDGQRPQAGNQLPPGLSEPPQLIGRLVRISPQVLELATQQGRRLITVNEDTFYRDHTDNTLELRELEIEQIVAVYGTFEQAGRELIADEIVVLPPPPER
jgi:hypothetical protein